MPRRKRQAIPEPIDRENTSEIVTGLVDELAGDRVSRARRYTPEQLVHQLVTRAQRSSNPKKFLGLSLAEAVKFGLAIVAAISTAYVGITRGVEQNAAAVSELRDEQKHSADHAEALGRRVEVIDRKADQLETRQEMILEGVREIRDEMRARRRRR